MPLQLPTLLKRNRAVHQLLFLALVLMCTVWSNRSAIAFIDAATAQTVGDTPPATAGDYNWDVSVEREWLPEQSDSLGDAQREAMRLLGQAYPVYSAVPAGDGVEQARIDAVTRRVRGHMSIGRDAETGEVTGRPVVFTSENAKPAENEAPLDFVGDIDPVFRELRDLYPLCSADSEQAAQLESLYRDLAQHLVNQRWDPVGEAEKGWLGNGYAWRNRQPVRNALAMRACLDDGLHDRLCETMCWLSGGHCFFDESPQLSTDVMLNTVWQAISAVCAMRAGPVKWQRIQCIRRAIDLGVLHSHRQGLVTPDGGVIHHDGMHVSYAGYSFEMVVRPHLRFAEAGILGKDSVAAAERLVAAGRAWAWFTQPGAVVPSMEMRIALPFAADDQETARSSAGGGGQIAWYAEQLVIALRGAGAEMAMDDPLPPLLLAKHPGVVPEPVRAAWVERGIVHGGMAGHLCLPVSGAALHRRGDYLVAIRGQNRFFRGGEGAAYSTWGHRISYAQRFCKGSLIIVDQGEPPNVVDSGIQAEGYNYALVPGTTGPMLPPRHMVARYFGTDASLGGGVTMDGQGLWGFAPSNCRKSALFIDNRFTLVTTAIRERTGYSVATTLCQVAHRDLPNEPIIYDGTVISAEDDLMVEDPRGHWFVDHLGRGYFVHESDGPLHIHRGEQSWTYTDQTFLKELAEGETHRDVLAIRPLEAMLERFSPTTGDFTTAYFTHGANPDGGRCAFSVLVNPRDDAMRSFADDMRGDEQPLAYYADERVHIYYDRGTGLRGYVFFESGNIDQNVAIGSSAGGFVISVGRPCFVMTLASEDTVRLAIASTDLDNDAPLSITFDGHWAITHASDAIATYGEANDSTTITTPFQGQTQIDITVGRQ